MSKVENLKGKEKFSIPSSKYSEGTQNFKFRSKFENALLDFWGFCSTSVSYGPV